MDRDSLLRMILVMVLGICVFLIWDKYFSPKDNAPPPRSTSAPVPAVQEPKTPGGEGPAAEEPAAGKGPRITVVSAMPENVAEYRGPVLGDSSYLGRYAMQVELTARGAGIRHVELSDYFESVDDRGKPSEERRKFQLVQRDVGAPAFVVTRVVLEPREGQTETIFLNLSPSKPLAELNGGRGVRLGKFVVGDGQKSVFIDVSQCRTVQDVLDKINTNGVVAVTAEISPTGDALVLRGGEDAELSVQESGDGHAASDLGILQPEPLGKAQPLVGANLEAWWTLDGEPTEDQATYKLDILRDGKPYLTLRKTIRLHVRPAPAGGIDFDRRFDDPQAYAADMTLAFEDHSKTLAHVIFLLRGPEGLVREESYAGRGASAEPLAAAGYGPGGPGPEFKSVKEAAEVENRLFQSDLEWAGVANKYFAFVAASSPDDTASRFQFAEAYLALDAEGEDVPGILMTSKARPFGAAGHTATATYMLFGGPKDDKLLDKPVYQERGLTNLVQWPEQCCCIPLPGLGYIAWFMVWSIDKISLLVVNKGLAIIILVILVQIVLLPINRFSQLSMLRMQELQPELAKLKERLKDDKQKLQVEQMKLMREKGVNPMMGCLPMLLQMPIWISLYMGLRVAISLRHAPFLLWVQDLSRPDGLMTIQPVDVPIVSWIGNWAHWQLNVLPILMLVTMFLQMKMQPSAAAATPEAERQQKMMKWMMPGMMLIFFYGAPSALNLYIMTSSFIRFWEQKYIRWHHAQIKKRPPKPRKERKKGFLARWMEAKLEDARRLQERAKKSENPFESRRKRK